MKVRVALTEIERDDGGSDAFVIAWPLSNDPAEINAASAEAAQNVVGGLPVVLVALADNGDLHTHGRVEHHLAVVDEGLDGRRWVTFDVPDTDGSAGVIALRPRPRQPIPPLAA